MDSQSVLNLQEFLENEKYEDALNLLSEKIGDNFVHEELTYARVYCLLKLGKWEEVLSTISQVPEEHQDYFVEYKALALYELHRAAQASKLPFTRKNQSSFNLALKSQVSYDACDYSLAKEAIVNLCKKEKNVDAEYNNEAISAVESTVRLGRGRDYTQWEELFTRSVGLYLRGEYPQAADLVSHNIATLEAAPREAKARVAAVALAAAAMAGGKELPFGVELMEGVPELEATVLALEGKGAEEEGLRAMQREGKISRPEYCMAVLFARTHRGEEDEEAKKATLFSLWPFCCDIPQTLCDCTASAIARTCTHVQLKTFLAHPELCTLEAVERARSFNDERLALALLSCVSRKQLIGGGQSADSIIGDARKVLTNMHVGKTRIKEAKTGHQGANADNITRASKITPQPAQLKQIKQIKQNKQPGRIKKIPHKR